MEVLANYGLVRHGKKKSVFIVKVCVTHKHAVCKNTIVIFNGVYCVWCIHLVLGLLKFRQTVQLFVSHTSNRSSSIGVGFDNKKLSLILTFHKICKL